MRAAPNRPTRAKCVQPLTASTACARMKKPIAGRPGIGAQFVIFNFPNSLIHTVTSIDLMGANTHSAALIQIILEA